MESTTGHRVRPRVVGHLSKSCRTFAAPKAKVTRHPPAAIPITLRSRSGNVQWLISNPPIIKQCGRDGRLSPAVCFTDNKNSQLCKKPTGPPGESPAKRSVHEGWFVNRTARRGSGISICSFWNRSITAR